MLFNCHLFFQTHRYTHAHTHTQTNTDTARSGPWRSKTKTTMSHTGSRDSGIQAIVLCLPGCISRKLDWKKSSQDLNCWNSEISCILRYSYIIIWGNWNQSCNYVCLGWIVFVVFFQSRHSWQVPTSSDS